MQNNVFKERVFLDGFMLVGTYGQVIRFGRVCVTGFATADLRIVCIFTTTLCWRRGRCLDIFKIDFVILFKNEILSFRLLYHSILEIFEENSPN